ncbi:MAG TPA: DNA methyltransferase [Candidatus Bathyarchaeia archaeon]
MDEWTFQSADTQYLTHGLHPYPARMIPQLASKLIARYSQERNWVLDPFCGSGTVLVECKLKNRNSIGNEINPLAVLLSIVKTTPLNTKELKDKSKELMDKVQESIHIYRNRQSKNKSTTIEKWTENNAKIKINLEDIKKPFFPNMNLWFKKDIADELSIIRNSILNLDWEEKYVNFFKICLSFTAMKASNADFESHQSHPSRYKTEKLNIRSLDVLSIFRKKVDASMKRVTDFSEKILDNKVECFVLSGDARKLDLKGIGRDKGVDLIVTSPPYGEEQNTIGYHRWSRIMAYWVGFSQDDIKKCERFTLGAKPDINVRVPSKTAHFFIDLVREKSKRKNGKTRAANLASFFYDYYESIVQMSKWLRPGGKAAIIVGNRLVAGHRISMDRVTVELAKKCELKEIKTYYRDIPNTVMPKRIPEGETIAKESIIVLEKK